MRVKVKVTKVKVVDQCHMVKVKVVWGSFVPNRLAGPANIIRRLGITHWPLTLTHVTFGPDP